MNARQRLIPAFVGIILFVVLGQGVQSDLWTAWWFYVGLGITAAVVFVEPFYSRAQDAVLTSLGGVGAWASADRTQATSLWTAYIVFCMCILVAGVYAALAATVHAGWAKVAKLAANHAAKTFGRAVVIGGAALGVHAIALASEGDSAYVRLAFATLALLIAVSPNWSKAVQIAKSPTDADAVAVSATGPRLLLVQSSERWQRGSRVSIKGPAGSANGWVVGSYSSSGGRQFELALDKDVENVCRSASDLVSIEADAPEGGGDMVGVAGPGSTDIRVTFTPMIDLAVGDSIQVGSGDQARLYQVSTLSLERESRGGTSSVLPHATGLLVGRPERGRVVARPRLPAPHEALGRAHPRPQSVPPGHTRIGLLGNTAVEIGIDHNTSHTGHFAVLGMSGMGKTTAALAICRALSANSCVIALDTTGEYKNRQGIGVHTSGSPAVPGFWVHEPTGDPPIAAKAYIEATMQTAYDEYVSGTPTRRVLLLEEAHGFIPEVNISTFAQRDATAESTRYIMQARKFELRFVMVSQRTAVVSKSALSQCENYIVLRSTDETSLTYLEAVMGRDVRQILPRLKRFEAVCMGPAFNADGPVIVSLDPPP